MKVPSPAAQPPRGARVQRPLGPGGRARLRNRLWPRWLPAPSLEARLQGSLVPGNVAPGGELAARAARCSPFEGDSCWKRSEKEQGGIFNDTCLTRKQEGGFCLFSLLYPPSSLYLLSDEGERVCVPENGAFSRPGSGISRAARLTRTYRVSTSTATYPRACSG